MNIDSVSNNYNSTQIKCNSERNNSDYLRHINKTLKKHNNSAQNIQDSSKIPRESSKDSEEKIENESKNNSCKAYTFNTFLANHRKNMKKHQQDQSTMNSGSGGQENFSGKSRSIKQEISEKSMTGSVNASNYPS